MTHTILRLPAVKAATGLSRSTTLPAHRPWGLHSSGEPGRARRGLACSEVAALNAARIAGKADAEIRALVAQLEAARKAVA